VLERPSQPVALLRIHAGEATLFSFLPSQEGRGLVHETFVRKIYDATITQVHAVENLADVSASKPERVEIAGSRIGGTINLTSYSADERAALMDALREIIPRG
jgi:cephalosporin-C deacetylase-like acetyl esterase